jgi:hypothetical protein
MSLWAISGAPLIVGADLAKLSPATLAMLTNAAVLAVDQDGAGLQATKAAEPSKGLQVWSKPLAGTGRRAVVLLNRTDAPASIPLHPADLGLGPSFTRVTDLWSGKQLTTAPDGYRAQVPAGDAVMLLVEGAEAKASLYRASAPEGVVERGHPVRFADVSSRSQWARIRIDYSNPGAAARYLALRVNGQTATRIAFPPTRDAEGAGAIWIQARLDRSGAANVLTFATDCDPGPVLHSIAVQ